MPSDPHDIAIQQPALPPGYEVTGIWIEAKHPPRSGVIAAWKMTIAEVQNFTDISSWDEEMLYSCCKQVSDVEAAVTAQDSDGISSTIWKIQV